MLLINFPKRKQRELTKPGQINEEKQQIHLIVILHPFNNILEMLPFSFDSFQVQ